MIEADEEAVSRWGRRVPVGDLGVDAVSEDDVLRVVAEGWDCGLGGMIVTPNVDIWRLARRDADLRRLVEGAELVVADGMPLVWAARLSGRPLPARVTGSGLVESLSSLAHQQGKSVFLIGGGVGGAVDRAAAALAERYPGLTVAGAMAPPFGFDQDPVLSASLVEAVVTAQPDLVLVGLGFPRQERFARRIYEQLPTAWFLGCGAGVEMAAGDTRRPPVWAQKMGVEWVVRLAQEPRRLARRYLVHDLPAAVTLLAGSVRTRYLA